MKIIFNTKALIEKIKNIAPTAEAKQTLVILGNMVIKVCAGVAQFTASDLEIQVSSSMTCESDQDYEFSLPAKKLLEIINALSNHDKVTFTVLENKLISPQEKVKFLFLHYLLLIFLSWIHKILVAPINLPQMILAKSLTKLFCDGISRC